ncbi:MAG TPA: hypothetical protein VFD55_01575 [Candidatus Angelobacter sp.]|nr:hypothetical protein [Candidatus Angelobacter sp.]
MNDKIQSKNSAIEEKVMKKIHSGKIHMRPKSHFIYLSALSTISIVLLTFIATYFISFATLWFRVQAAKGPAFGARQNLAELAGSFPWWALIMGLISLAGAIYFIHKTGQMYKLRLQYLVPILLTVLIALGFIFSYSNLPRMFNGRKVGVISCYEDNITCDSSIRGYVRNR